MSSTRKGKFEEHLIRYIWISQHIKDRAKTQSGRQISVISPGALNQEDGPDFKHAKISFDGEPPIAGDVEIHMKSSGWLDHKHNFDPKYNDVILHVVMQDDTLISAVREDGKRVETLELSRYLDEPIAKIIEEYSGEKRMTRRVCPYTPFDSSILEPLEVAGMLRFEERKKRFKQMIEEYGYEQAIYLAIMEALGYVKNEKPFMKLAKLVPIEWIKSVVTNKPKGESVLAVEAALFGVAGLLPSKADGDKYIGKLMDVWDSIKATFTNIMRKEEWQFFKVRPSNFPTKRIAGMAHFLVNIYPESIYDFLVSNFSNLSYVENKLCESIIPDYFINHTTFGSKRQKRGTPLISNTCARIITLNVFLPILSVIYELQGESNLQNEVINIYKNYDKLPENNIIRLMSKRLFGNRKDLKSYCKEIHCQGMLHIFKKYCENRLCDACPVLQRFKRNVVDKPRSHKEDN
ncbi:MAG TPA: DUF2851 family protein [bacterium (Candidatus Stahlbacteria)]|nr:DUF2851 family protein [Candidatus Stahlbacteria bacterium]